MTRKNSTIIILSVLCIIWLAGCESSAVLPASSPVPSLVPAPVSSPQTTLNVFQPAHWPHSLNGFQSLDTLTEQADRIHLPPGTSYMIMKVQNQFSEIRDIDGLGGWIPTWYLTDESSQAAVIEPMALSVIHDANALWFPEGDETASALKAGDKLYAYQQYGEWYGVVVPRKVESPSPAFLLWVSKSAVQDAGAVPDWFSEEVEEENAIRFLSIAIPSLLVPDIGQARVRRLFGEPYYIEQSENIADIGEKPVTLPIWHYKNGSTHLIIGWNEDGSVKFSQYGKLLETGTTLSESPGSQYMMPSVIPEWEWRFQSDLPYNFLLDKIGNNLIIAGEDGGFSGMHMKSNVYALNADTGHRIWQYDLGYDAHLYGTSKDKSLMAFLKRENKSNSINVILEAVKTKSGEKVWQQTIEHVNARSLAVSGQVVTVVYSDMVNGTDTSDFTMQAWDIRTGKTLWSKKLPKFTDAAFLNGAGRFEVLLMKSYTNPNGYDPNGGLLIGYDPKTGKELWKMDQRISDMYTFLTDPTRHTEGTGAIWTRTNTQLLLTDVKTGRDIEEYPLEEDSMYEVINDEYLFLVKRDREDRDNNEFSSSLIRRGSGDPVFTESGYASFGMIDGEKLYYRLNSDTFSYDLKSGHKFGTPSSSDFIASGPTVIFDDQIISAFPYRNIYLLDRATLKPTARLIDSQVGLYDITPDYFVQGFLTVIDQKLYAGSSNGWFSKIKSIGEVN